MTRSRRASRGTDDRYDLATGCFRLSSAFGATEVLAGNADGTPLLFQPLDLGKYLLVAPDDTFFAADAGPVEELDAAASSLTDWMRQWFVASHVGFPTATTTHPCCCAATPHWRPTWLLPPTSGHCFSGCVSVPEARPAARSRRLAEVCTCLPERVRSDAYVDVRPPSGRFGRTS